MSKPSDDVRLVVFDTEGTKVGGDNQYAILWFWDFLILDGDWHDVSRETVSDQCHHVSGRDCSSLYSQIMSMIDDACDTDSRWLVAVHNISYDICYLRKFLIDCDAMGYRVEVSAKSSTRFLTVNIYVKDYLAFTFFDTLALFGYSLRKLGSNLGFPKLEMDYDKVRYPNTPISKDELAYNLRDTEVLMVGVCQSLLTRPSVDLQCLGRSVLTKTSIVRKMDREHVRIGALPLKVRRHSGSGNYVKSGARTIYDDDRGILKRHQFEKEEDYWNWASYGDTQTSAIKGFFAGGVNISNTNLIGKVLDNVVSYDLKSAYPAIMLSYRVPTKPMEIDATEFESYKGLLAKTVKCVPDVLQCRNGFWFGCITFKGFRAQRKWWEAVGDTSLTDAMVHQYKGRGKGLAFEGGCLVSADSITLKLASSEFYELVLQYDWDDAEFEQLTLYTSSETPTKYSILRTLFHYNEKSVAKSVSKEYKRGERPTKEELDEWLSQGYITYDEHEAISDWNIDANWVEEFVLGHKGNLNALYGINVTNPLREEYALDDYGFLCDAGGDKFERYLESSRNSLMWREAGVCIALFNRYKIVYMARMQVDAGAKVVYIDTDSIKSIGLAKDELDKLYKNLHDDIENATDSIVRKCVENVNRDIKRVNQFCGTETPYIPMPCDQSFKDLGKLDYEGTYEKFVTMGHKKYAVIEGGHWVFKCSGYALGVLNEFGKQYDHLGDMVPILVLGFDNRFDSSTRIATIQKTIPDMWIKIDVGTYKGETCPGYAILEAGKIMNNTENSAMNRQRFDKACENNPAVRALSGIDIREDDGVFRIGKRGTVPMDWADWQHDWQEGVFR